MPDHAPPVTRLAPGSRRTLAVVALGTAMLMLDVSVVAVALPQLRRTFGAGIEDLQWVLDAYAVLLAATLLPAGALADRFGAARAYAGGMTVFTVASLACGLAGSAPALIGARAVQGLAAAVLLATGPALLAAAFPEGRRAAAFGVFGAAAGVAVAAGPVVGGAMVSALGWQWVFLLNLPVGIVALALVLPSTAAPPAPRARVPRRRDTVLSVLGAVSLVVGLGAVMHAVIQSAADGWGAPVTAARLAVAGCAFVAFGLTQRAQGPGAALDLRAVRSRALVGLAAVSLLASAAGLPTIFLQTSYVQDVLGATPWQAGLRFLPLTLAMLASGASGGVLAARLPPRVVVAGACAALAGGLLLALRAEAGSDWTVLVPGMVLVGAGLGLLNAARAALAVTLVAPHRTGIASGVVQACAQAGTAVGIAVSGAVLQVRSARLLATPGAGDGDGDGAVVTALADGVPGSAQAFVAGFHAAMLACSAAAVLAVALAWYVLPARAPARAPRRRAPAPAVPAAERAARGHLP